MPKPVYIHDFTVERSEDWISISFHEGNLTSVEGPIQHMKDLRDALIDRDGCSHKRCSCEPAPNGHMLIWSRNSIRKVAINPRLTQMLIADITQALTGLLHG